MTRTQVSRFLICLALAAALLAGAAGLLTLQPAAGAEPPASPPSTQPPRLPTAPPGRSSNAPEISFIDSPGATCYQMNVRSNKCAINWTYLYVTAAQNQYIISMTVAIDNRLRANYQGFFQNSMYIPPNLMEPGLRVACGARGTSGNPYLGRAYAYTIRARETGGLRSANYGTVYCPADSRLKLFLPITPRRR